MHECNCEYCGYYEDEHGNAAMPRNRPHFCSEYCIPELNLHEGDVLFMNDINGRDHCIVLDKDNYKFIKNNISIQ